MAGETWSHQISGHELNDIVNFVTTVPQIDDIPDFDIKSVPIDGTYPAFIRADPASGIYTFLINMSGCTSAVFQSRLATLGSWFAPGLLTYSFQVRGMAAPKSVLVVPRGRAVDYKLRQVVYTCYVPVPVPA